MSDTPAPTPPPARAAGAEDVRLAVLREVLARGCSACGRGEVIDQLHGKHWNDESRRWYNCGVGAHSWSLGAWLRKQIAELSAAHAPSAPADAGRAGPDSEQLCQPWPDADLAVFIAKARARPEVWAQVLGDALAQIDTGTARALSDYERVGDAVVAAGIDDPESWANGVTAITAQRDAARAEVEGLREALGALIDAVDEYLYSAGLADQMSTPIVTLQRWERDLMAARHRAGQAYDAARAAQPAGGDADA